MHPALYIEEILEEIFEWSLEKGHGTLCQAARCCRAWKDPALDRVWRRLSSSKPLFQLIPGITIQDQYHYVKSDKHPPDLRSFHSYAARVKHLAHRYVIRIDPILLSSLVTSSVGIPAVLPNLTTVHAMIHAMDTLSPFYVSQKLRYIDLDLGFTSKRGMPPQRETSEYLEQIATTALDIEHVKVRGLMSPRFNDTIASMHNLRVLSLHTGASLNANTLAAIMTFPLLNKLHIRAGHLETKDLVSAFDARAAGAIPFPVLRDLRLHVRASCAEFLLEKLQEDTLQTLLVDLEPEHAAQTTMSWGAIFELLRVKARRSLRQLYLECDLPALHDEPTHHIILEPLRHLTALRRLTVDTGIPPDFCDADIVRLSRWWPMLTHLDLGDGPSQRTTMACLPALAKWCPRLEFLSLPIDVEAIPEPPAECHPPQTALRTFVCADTSARNAAAVNRYLAALFPSLAAC
ncbi:hypothetical protein PLICRDRAFT_112497 [Plicaturopsis crispa FD-325 SS-3]|nr:hypothetical protein PLICRDRAFT_112497 [Plicaturopsis crispa FD-325 SS-3]